MTTSAAAVSSAARATVLRVKTLSNPEYREIDVAAPHVTRTAQPGQFVHVRPAGGGGDLPLRRPFSLAGCEGDVLTILFKRVGALTERLAFMTPGQELDILGPLGRGYDLSLPRVDHAVLVGGGYGVAPLLMLGRALKRDGKAGTITMLTGARTAAQLLWQDRLATEPGIAAHAATDDGTAGFKGTALDLLASLLPGLTGTTRFYACGPMPMLGAIHRRWPAVPFQAAVENQMGCGIGVCVGCVLPVAGTAGYDRYVRICCDGPVFDGAFIDWASCPKH